MEPCNRCGAVDQHRTIALMSRWFAAHAGLPLEGGYFYLCPACYSEKIEAEFDAIAERIRAYQKPDRASREEALEADAAAQAAASASAREGAVLEAAAGRATGAEHPPGRQARSPEAERAAMAGAAPPPPAPGRDAVLDAAPAVPAGDAPAPSAAPPA